MRTSRSSGTGRRPTPRAIPRPTPRPSIAGTACHPAPYPNDGLPMGLRRGNGPDGSKVGIAIDCMACHGGSIGGTSYVGLGNTQLDLKLLFHEMLKADGKRLPPSTFVINSSRGTVNAGMFSVVLLSLRNPDLSFRNFPLPLGANLPELDVPAWWLLGKKSTMYYDGRTDARSVRTNMQFMLGEKTLAQFKELEPTFRDIQAYFKSLNAAQISVPDRPAEGRPGQGGLRQDLRQVPRDLRPGRRVSQPDRRAEGDRHRPGPGPGDRAPIRGPLQFDLVRRGISRRRGDDRLSGPAARRDLGDGPLPPQRLGADAGDPAEVVGSAGPLLPAALDRFRPLRPGRTSAGNSRSRPSRRTRRCRPRSRGRCSTRPGSAWATAAIPSAITSRTIERSRPDRVPQDALNVVSLVRASRSTRA